MFNLWRKYPRRKPKTAGWYQCTVQFGDGVDDLRVMDLYYESWTDTWLDKRRLNVFDGYKVYQSSRAPIEDNRVHSDVLCDLSRGVIAWRKLPKPKRCGHVDEN